MVSILVPIYNTEKYIHRCFNSILNQSYKNIEAIFVDDGSPDLCGKICDDFALKDKRIKVIHQSNNGICIARQKAFDIASGEYFLCLDSDDWIEPDVVECMYLKAKEDDADVVLSDFIIENKSGSHYISQRPEELTGKAVYKDILSKRRYPNLSTMLIKTSCVKERGIRFDKSPVSLGEDYFFACRLFMYNLKISYLEKAFSHYDLNNNNSICHKISANHLNNYITIISELEKEIEKEDLSELFQIKKEALLLAFLLKKYNLLKTLYPEVNN